MAVSHSLAVIKLQQAQLQSSRRPNEKHGGQSCSHDRGGAPFLAPRRRLPSFSLLSAQGMMELRCEMGACAWLTETGWPFLGSRKCNARSGLYDMLDLAGTASRGAGTCFVFVATVTCEGERPGHETTW